MKNHALRAYPRSQPAPVIPLSQEPSILDWLESSNRLLERDTVASDFDEEEQEITELMGADDDGYDDDDDSSDDDD